MDGRDLRDYQSCIHEALLKNQVPEEKSCGLMRWYDKQDGVKEKVQSIVFGTESLDGQLWCVSECKVVGELLPEGMDLTALNLLAGKLAGFEPTQEVCFEGLVVWIWIKE